MKRDKLFRLSLAILFLWTSFALAAPAAMAASSTALPGSSLWVSYLQQSRIDLEKAASSPWETLKSFLPRSFGALVRQTASRYTSVLLFLTLTAVLLLFVLFYHKLFAITFDESFSRATGVRVELYNTVLSVLTALTIVLGMRLMGAMLISSLVIFPALTAMRLLRSFRGVVLCAAAVSVLGFCVGLTGSYLLSTPVGATVVLVDLAVFLLACLLGRLKKHA